MNTLEKLTFIRRYKEQNIWAERIITELEFAYKLLDLEESYTQIVEKAIDYIYEKLIEKGYITKEYVDKAEAILMPMSDKAKEFTIICVGHAHIDMNWMWGYHETVAVTLDTFKTVLNLMNEYKDFTFSQSQASIYKIVEENNPKMLEEIKKRVKEGRWEIITSTWVETDKNMPSGESLSRHILYTKKYISSLFGIEKNSLLIDFEPDTFGHSKFVPSILSKGGVRYYYHCRGNDKNIAYRWKSSRDDEILVYKEPFWYNDSIKADMALFVPEFYKLYGTKYMLKVYGVGDHGGGPTRRDIEKIIELNSYPIYPNVKFGTYKEFFSKLEAAKEKIPLVEGEQNFVFDGCFTTQTRIKMANRISEKTIEETEKFGLISNVLSEFEYPYEKIEKSWQNILFNHFHDIIPGSGVTETREHAMGLFQETMATLLSQKKIALESIAANINTKIIFDDINNISSNDEVSISEGAGAAFKSSDYLMSQDSVGRGKRRIFHLFNPSSSQRKENVEITLWDWEGDLERLYVKDYKGNIVRHQIIDKTPNIYWNHRYIRILIEVEVPAYGYTTYILDEESSKQFDITFPMDPRVQTPLEFVLENKYIKATFDTSTAKLISLFDKENNIELIDRKRGGAHFRLINEDIKSGANAWVVGRYLDIADIHENVKIRKNLNGELRDSIVYEFEFGNNSHIIAHVWLDKDSRMLNFKTEIDFKEVADLKKSTIPQLSFYVPLSFECRKFLYDIPYGVIERDQHNLDVPGLSFACARTNKNLFALFSKTKYGYRAIDNSVSLTLIRSSHEPDPYPEFGIHKIEFALYADCNNKSAKELLDISYNYNHEISVLTNNCHDGKLTLTNSFMNIESNSTIVSAVKKSEDKQNKLIIRLYEVEGKNDFIKISFNDIAPKKAYCSDINEERFYDSIAIIDRQIHFNMHENEIKTVIIEY